MKLKNIKITNYRCFKETDIVFDDHITLIVGKNGAGKTAILDAVAVAVSTFLLGIDGGVSRGFQKMMQDMNSITLMVLLIHSISFR